MRLQGPKMDKLIHNKREKAAIKELLNEDQVMKRAIESFERLDILICSQQDGSQSDHSWSTASHASHLRTSLFHKTQQVVHEAVLNPRVNQQQVSASTTEDYLQKRHGVKLPSSKYQSGLPLLRKKANFRTKSLLLGRDISHKANFTPKTESSIQIRKEIVESIEDYGRVHTEETQKSVSFKSPVQARRGLFNHHNSRTQNVTPTFDQMGEGKKQQRANTPHQTNNTSYMITGSPMIRNPASLPQSAAQSRTKLSSAATTQTPQKSGKSKLDMAEEAKSQQNFHQMLERISQQNEETQK